MGGTCMKGPDKTIVILHLWDNTLVTTVHHVYAPVSIFLPPAMVAGALPRQNRRRGVPGKPTLSLSCRST